jgi:hypothetical protein
MSTDTELVTKLLTKLKMAGGKFSDEPHASHVINEFIHETRAAGNLGRAFVIGRNAALTEAADLIGWGEDQMEARNKVLGLRVAVKKAE